MPSKSLRWSTTLPGIDTITVADSGLLPPMPLGCLYLDIYQNRSFSKAATVWRSWRPPKQVGTSSGRTKHINKCKASASQYTDKERERERKKKERERERACYIYSIYYVHLTYCVCTKHVHEAAYISQVLRYVVWSAGEDLEQRSLPMSEIDCKVVSSASDAAWISSKAMASSSTSRTSVAMAKSEVCRLRWQENDCLLAFQACCSSFSLHFSSSMRIFSFQS